jgi:hypothetical protein
MAAADVHLPPIDDSGALEDAVEMNRRLKAMLREMEAQGRMPAAHPTKPPRSGDVSSKGRRTEAAASSHSDIKSSIDRSPPAAGPVRAPKSNFTYTDDRLVDIAKGNHLLVEKLAKISVSKSSIPGAHEARAPVVASSSINRRRAAAKIQNDNEVCTGVIAAFSRQRRDNLVCVRCMFRLS